MRQMENAQPNNLIHETSTYLLQHAYNPVNWHAWNPETLQLAEQKNLPVLISIGYSACHWCHVMEKESFEDQDVAHVLNTGFVCIKIDREERPDLDHIYMQALQVITGQGGWPLNIFALPNMLPFHGGTYFTKQNFLHVLNRVSEEFSVNRDKLASYADNLHKGLIQQQKPLLQFARNKPDLEILEKGIEAYQQHFDKINGGDSGSPKFPMPSNLLFLAKWSNHKNHEEINTHLHLTLTKMARGGIYDQLGGGFCRYSTDSYWKVPHFEKMLYDNAQLLRVYARAFEGSNHSEYKRLCKQILAWLDTEMQSENGMYFSALDADSEGEEGKYYVWDKTEFSNLLGTDADLALQYYNVNKLGEWEGKYILIRELSDEQFAIQYGLEIDELLKRTDSIRDKLLKVRSERPKPQRDSKIICSWNALTIRGLCSAYVHLEDESFLIAAKRVFRSLEKTAWNQGNGSLLRIIGESSQKHPGLLEDFAHFGLASIDLYRITTEEAYLKIAFSVAENMLNRFFDEENRLFYTSDLSRDDLIFRPSENFDGVLPSSSSAACELLWLAGHYSDNAEWVRISRELTMANTPFIEKYLNHFSAWSSLYLDMCNGPLEIAVVGKEASQMSKALLKKYPDAILSVSETESDLPLLNGKFEPSKTLIFICLGQTCLAPVESLEQAGTLLESLRGEDVQ